MTTIEALRKATIVLNDHVRALEKKFERVEAALENHSCNSVQELQDSLLEALQTDNNK